MKRLGIPFCCLFVLLLLFRTKYVRFERGKHEGESLYLLIGKRTFAYPINEWRQFREIGQCNWYGFTPVYLYFEIDEMSKMYEFTITVLGLGFYLRIDRDFEHSLIKTLADEALVNYRAERLLDFEDEDV